jgi:hypothetical protein
VTVKVQPLGLQEIELRLQVFEKMFGVPSERFAEAFRKSPVRETREFHEWATLVSARELILRHREA